MKGLRLGLGQSKLQDKWTAEAKMCSAKTVCTAGGGLWQAKHPPLLVLGNVTLAPPRPGLERCWSILPGILASVPACTLTVGVVEGSIQAC